jgi:hypothetical protein
VTRDARRILRRDQDVEVADGVALAAEAAGDLSLDDGLALAQMGNQRSSEHRCFAVEHPRRRLALRERLEDALLDFCAEAPHRPELSRLDRDTQAGAVADAETVGEQIHSLGAESGQGEQLEQSGRYLRKELAIQREIASRDERDDFFGEVRANAWNLLERLALEPGDGCGVSANGARGVAIGAHAEEVLAADL